jgi:hypothetical protein
MGSDDRAFLRLHVEAVWGVRLPPIERNELTLLPASVYPEWRLYAADLAAGRICIWRPDVGPAERAELLARLRAVLSLPASGPPSQGSNREEVFRLDAEPVITLEAARQLARLLTPDDYALIEAFEPGSAAYYLKAECRPPIGVVVDGRLLSVAHSSRRTSEACELGIDTLPQARRRGYALAATVVWSQTIVQEGLVPIYSALAENTASLNLAIAAGYRRFAYAVTIEYAS